MRDELTALKVDLKAANDAKRDINAGIAAAKDLLREHKAVEKAISGAQRAVTKAARKKAPGKRKPAVRKAAAAKKPAAKKVAKQKVLR